jgi:hypothetical protein
MKRFAAALAIIVCLLAFTSARAQFGVPAAQAIGGPVGSPTYVGPAPAGGIINVGQAFNAAVAPYVDAAVQAGIAALVSWLLLGLQKKTGIAIDAGHRQALTTALQNQAGSLLADGMVKMAGVKVNVDSPALAKAANDALASIPDVEKHFGLTPEYVAARIIDTIPQIAAGAAMVAQAHATAGAPDPKPAPHETTA